MTVAHRRNSETTGDWITLAVDINNADRGVLFSLHSQNLHTYVGRLLGLRLFNPPVKKRQWMSPIGWITDS